jgi:hypothetical protein
LDWQQKNLSSPVGEPIGVRQAVTTILNTVQ